MLFKNNFGQWKVGQVVPTKDDIFDPDISPEKCSLAVNKKIATNPYKCIYNLKTIANTFHLNAH